MVDLGERLENSLENLRIERGESEEKGQLYKVLTTKKIPHCPTAMTDEDAFEGNVKAQQ